MPCKSSTKNNCETKIVELGLYRPDIFIYQYNKTNTSSQNYDREGLFLAWMKILDLETGWFELFEVYCFDLDEVLAVNEE